MNTAPEEEDDMLNCPDCQLQTLQHQQNQPSGDLVAGPVSARSQTYNPQETTNDNNYRSTLQHNVETQSVVREHLHFGSSHVESSRDVGCDGVNKGNYVSSPSGFSYRPNVTVEQCSNSPDTSTPVTNALMSASTTVSIGPLSSGADMLAATTCITPVPLESCDLSGYCPTCAVLDLPPNDKFYRTNISRPSVFPTLFYGQGPSLPGFSPLPDCTPWGNCNSNEFASYSYSHFQPQGASSSASTSDYFTSTTVLPGIQSPMDNFGQGPLMSSCLYSYPNKSISAQSEELSDCKKHYEVAESSSKTGKFMEERETAERDQEPMPICISSSSEDSSDSGISQREVIVEDDEDEDHGSLRLCELDRELKCMLCQNQITITDCASPQLVNILENLHEDITAEDLDITVSSGDIEIGGIEDEVRDFNSKKPGLHQSNQLNLGRLAALVNVPVDILMTLHNRDAENDVTVQNMEHVAVNLCNKCFKLASAADNMEKQLRSYCILLKQILQPHVLLNLNCEASQPGIHFGNDSNSSPMRDEYAKPCDRDIHARARVECKVTQTDNSEYCTESPVSANFGTFPSFRTLAENAFIIGEKKNEFGLEFREHATSGDCIMYPDEGVCNPREYGTKATAHLTSFVNIDFSCSEKTTSHSSLSTHQLAEIGTADSNKSSFAEKVVLGDLNSEISDIVHLLPHLDSGQCADFKDPISEGNLHEMDGGGRSDIYLCEECGKCLHSEKCFRIHTQRHQNELALKCTICQKGFANPASLKVHVRSHSGEKPFKCSKGCGKAFSTKSNLTTHADTCPDKVLSDINPDSNVLPEGKKFECDSCGLAFRLKKCYEKHRRKGCQETIFTCFDCSKRFSKKSELKAHLSVHQGLKPFSCSVCSANFATRGNLSAHLVTHSLEKRFKCEICSKGFNRKQALEIHKNRHKGIRAYACNMCDSKFYDPGNLQNHRKIHVAAT